MRGKIKVTFGQCENTITLGYLTPGICSLIRSSGNDSTGFGHQVRCIPWVQMGTSAFMWIEIICIEYVLWGIPTIESTFDVANMVKTATVKDVPISNDALLNIQAC